MTTAPTASRPSTPSPSGRGPMPGTGAGPANLMVALDPIRMLRRYYPLLVGAAVLGGVLGYAAHIVLLRVRPTYKAEVVYQCLPPTVDPAAPPTTQSLDEFTRFIGTQVAIMTSEPVLQSALKDSDVERSNWAKQFVVNGKVQPNMAVIALSKDLSARIIANTNLIQLTMSARDAADTAAIVNAVNRAYIEDLRRSERQNTVERRDVLNGRIRALNDEMVRLNAERDRLIQENNVTDLDAGTSAADQKIARIQNDLVTAGSNQDAMRTLLEKDLKMMETTQAIAWSDDLLAEGKFDPIIQNFEQQIASLQAEDRSLAREGFQEKHPTVQAVRSRIRATQDQMQEKLEEVLRKLLNTRIDGYRTQIQVLGSQQDQLFNELVEAKKTKEDLLRVQQRVRQVDENIARASAELAAFSQAVRDMETISGSPSFDRIRVVRSAQIPTTVSFPKLAIMLPLGVVLLGGLTATAIVLRELFDQRVRGPSDLSVIPRLRVLGMIPEGGEDPSRPAAVESAMRDCPGGVVSESIRQVRSTLLRKMRQDGQKSLVVVGGMPGSGATTVVSNLAVAFAGSDEKVLVIDANLRRPGIHKAFKLSEAPGLGEVLAGEASVEQVVQDAGVPNVWVITAGGSANRFSPERLSSDAMSRVMAEVTDRFDRVILDAPPAIVSGDGLALANRCDASMLVVRALKEKRGLVNRLRTQFSECRGELLGVVVNAVRSSAGGYFKRNIRAAHEYQNSK